MKESRPLPSSFGVLVLQPAQRMPKSWERVGVTEASMTQRPLLLLFFFAAFAQLCTAQIPALPCTLQGAVSTAQDLKNALAAAGPGTTVYICGTIDLGDLSQEDLPLDIKEGVTLAGDYDMFTNPYGSLVTVPYQFKDGRSCRYGYVNQNGFLNNKATGFAFDMYTGATIRGIRLQGPSTAVKDWRYLPLATNCDDPVEPIEGMMSGICARYTDCSVESCEIYGFGHFAMLVDIRENDTHFNFRRNLVHHNKRLGFGYGIWVTGKANDPCTPTITTCNGAPIPPGEQNKYRTTMGTGVTAHISRCIFWENKHDIAGSGNTNSYDVEFCTFSQSSGDVNIDRHAADSWVCNPVIDPNPALPCAPGEACHEAIIKDVGGLNTIFSQCLFYRATQSVKISYPNTNTCGVGPGSVRFTNNYFKSTDPTGANKINIAEVNDWRKWINNPDIVISNNDFADDATQITSMAELPPCAIIASYRPGIPYTPPAPPPGLAIGNSVQQVFVGESLNFMTDYCNTISGAVLDDGAVYMWRFHEASDDYADVIWTSKHTDVTPLVHTFNRAGVVHVDLMAIGTNGLASDIVTQRIMVKPVENDEVLLTFWISDSYTGDLLTACSTPQTPPNLRSSYTDTSINPDHAPTNFEVYAMVNGTKVWHKDIAEFDGWLSVEVPITPYLNSIGNPSATDQLEIGIEAIAPVDGGNVRGVDVFVDDVYINGADGANTLRNADFESSGSSFIWTRLNECETCRPVPWPPDCPATGFEPPGYPLSLYPGSSSPTLQTTGNIRSGSNSLEMYIRNISGMRIKGIQPGAPVQVLNYTPGMHYSKGRYKGVRQNFKHGVTYKSASAGPSASVAPSFVIMPNPTDATTGFTIAVDDDGTDEPWTLLIHDAHGRLVHSTVRSGTTFHVDAITSSGIYSVTLLKGTFTSTQRFVLN